MKFKATTSRSNNISKVAQAQANDQNVHPDNHHSANCQPSSTTQNKQAN